jgi:hypothetical protein
MNWPLLLLGFISSLPQLGWGKGFDVVVVVVVAGHSIQRFLDAPSAQQKCK